MAATTTTESARAETAPSQPPTDEQILSQLATLQSLHASIFQLRSLLPERLIDPVKAAVDASRVGYEPPAALAEHLRSVAVDGDKSVKEFHEGWRSEGMRDVWTASRESKFPQGSDVWGVEYRKLVCGDGEMGGKGRSEVANENVHGVIEKFKAGNAKVLVERKSEASSEGMVNVTVVGETFVITKSEGVGPGATGEWLVSSKAGGQVTERHREMERCLQERSNKQSLEFVLDMVASYADLKTRACEKCKNLFDIHIQLPIVRVSNPKPENGSKEFLGYHKGCL